MIFLIFLQPKKQEKKTFEKKKKVNCIFNHVCLATDIIILSFDFSFFLAPLADVLWKTADFSHYFQILRQKCEFESNFLNTPTGGLNLNH